MKVAQALLAAFLLLITSVRLGQAQRPELSEDLFPSHRVRPALLDSSRFTGDLLTSGNLASLGPARDTPGQEVPAADLAFLGALGGAVGCIPGGVVGATAYRAVRQPEPGDLEGLAYALAGCLGGAALGVATGVHLGNHRRGSFWWDLVAAAAIGAVGIGVATSSDAPAASWWLIPISAISMAVIAEKHVERHSQPQPGPR
jgi:hypothetical protein